MQRVLALEAVPSAAQAEPDSYLIDFLQQHELGELADWVWRERMSQTALLALTKQDLKAVFGTVRGTVYSHRLSNLQSQTSTERSV